MSMPVDFFKGTTTRSNLRHVSLKLVKFEKLNFNWPSFCFYANFCNLCPDFVIHWSIFSDFVFKMFRKTVAYCKIS